MAVIDDLPGGEWGRREFHAVDTGVEPALQELDQIVAGIPAPPHRLLVQLAELAFADIGVVALQLLLRHQLGAVIRRLLAPLAVLAGSIFAAIERALRPPPQIDTEPAVDLVLRFLALAHMRLIRFRLLLSR